jgi:Putative MetA-pathway of phenol degradation
MSTRTLVMLVVCALAHVSRVDAQTTMPPSSAVKDTRTVMGELVTDRPDITESTEVVGAHVWQLEAGVSLESDGAGVARSRELVVPLALLRVGLGRRVELRLSADGAVSDTSAFPGSTRHSGRSDVEVALKWKLFDQDRLGVDLAIIPILSLPTGSDDFTSDGYDPALKVAWARELPQGFGLSGNINVASLTEDDDRFTEQDLSASLGHALAAGWDGYVELFTASHLEREGGRAWIFDTGVTHGIGPNTQFDVNVGRGLRDAGPDWYIGAGFALRGLFGR